MKTYKRHSLLFIVLSFVCFFSCKEEALKRSFPTDIVNDTYIPEGFIDPNSISEEVITKYKVMIGKRMFFDKNLSSTKEISCASCHIPSKAFSDTVALSKGVFGRLGLRNSPSLANVAYKPIMFADGGSPTLELQVTAPIQDHNEMNMDYLEAIEYIKNDPLYNFWSRVAYGKEPDAFVFTRSIASYQRTLLSGDAKYDMVMRGEDTFTSSEANGFDLFNSSRTNCSSCHSGNMFTDYSYQNIGLYTNYLDSGRMRITLDENDRGKFIVPSLRNIELTAPYMHNGSLATLEGVITFFNSGGHPHPNKSTLVKELSLTSAEKQDIINFLYTLTDNSFIDRHE